MINPNPTIKERFPRTIVFGFMSLVISAIVFHFYHEPHLTTVFVVTIGLFVFGTTSISYVVDRLTYNTVQKIEFNDNSQEVVLHFQSFGGKITTRNFLYRDFKFSAQRFIRNRYTADKEKHLELLLLCKDQQVAKFENSTRLDVGKMHALIDFLKEKFPNQRELTNI